MNKEQLAQLLNGRQYRDEITKEEESQAEKDGLVVVFGASDDLIEFRGAIYDEVGDGTVYLTGNDIFDENACDDDRCPYKKAARKNCKTIDSEFGEGGYSWIFETEIPHATFDIMEDDDKYCRGIVFHISSLS